MSENIFKEIYAKVISLFKQTEKEDNAKDIAKNRLRVVLMQDRTNLTPELMERMRKELVELLSKYVEMDKEALELNLDQEGDQVALMLSIPVIRAKDEAEIEKVIAESETDEEDSEDESSEEDTNSEENSEGENSEQEASEEKDSETETSDEQTETAEESQESDTANEVTEGNPKDGAEEQETSDKKEKKTK